jgi:hypothetical protein
MNRPAFRFSNYQIELLIWSLNLFLEYEEQFWPPRDKWLTLPGLPSYEIQSVYENNLKTIRIIFSAPVQIGEEINTIFRLLPPGARITRDEPYLLN